MHRCSSGVRLMFQDQSLCTLGSGHPTLSSEEGCVVPPPPSIQTRSAFLAKGRRLWSALVALKGRHAVRRLAELDSRLLADVGITRADLSDALREPLFRNPTDLLAQRARQRWQAEQRSVPPRPDTGFFDGSSKSKGEP